jgi:hypothetical protein
LIKLCNFSDRCQSYQQGTNKSLETWSKVIELRRSSTALKVNPNQLARALHRKRARDVILVISAHPT